MTSTASLYAITGHAPEGRCRRATIYQRVSGAVKLKLYARLKYEPDGQLLLLLLLVPTER